MRFRCYGLLGMGVLWLVLKVSYLTFVTLLQLDRAPTVGSGQFSTRAMGWGVVGWGGMGGEGV